MAENTNVEEISRANLSEMDKIFIPEDLDNNVELGDFVSYKSCSVKFWRSVPENCRLVTVNWFTKKVKFKEGFGLKLVPPLFTRTILVPAPMQDGIKTFKDIECLSLDRIEIKMDVTLSMNIIDPAKYMKKGKNQLSQLTSIIKRLLRVYVANKNFDELVAEECPLSLFDRNRALIDFEEECGIQINKVIFEKIQLPERLKKLYNDAAEEEQKRKAQAVRLRAAKEKADTDAEVMGIQSKAEASRIKEIEKAKAEAWRDQMEMFVNSLSRQNIPTEQIAKLLTEQLKVKTATEGNANTFISLGNGNSQAADIAAGLRAANQLGSSTNNEPSQSTPTNSQRLLNDGKVLVALGQITQTQYNAFEQTLADNSIRAQIDSCSQDAYSILFNKFFSNPQQPTTQSGRTR